MKMDHAKFVSISILVGTIIFVSGVIYGAAKAAVDEHEIQCDGFYIIKDANKIIVGDTCYSNVNSDIRYSNGTLKFTTSGEFNYDGYKVMLIGPSIIGMCIIISITLKYIENRRVEKEWQETKKEKEEE